MNLNLSNKRALVGGSSKGIGAAIAEELAKEGAKVTLIARNEEELQTQVSKLDGEGHDYLVVDFSEKAQVDSLVEKVKSQPYDIIVNNTGGPPPGLLQDANIESFEQAIHMHLYVSHQLMQASLPHMKAQRYGRFINVISTSVRIPIKGLGVSNTTRGAMASWSKTLSNEVAPYGITVNNILPGAVATTRLDAIINNTAAKNNITVEQAADQMKQSIPAGRFAEPEELGALAAFLASEKAAYITGVSIQVDGGRTGSI